MATVVARDLEISDRLFEAALIEYRKAGIIHDIRNTGHNGLVVRLGVPWEEFSMAPDRREYLSGA
jgi:hypothetical protein